MYLYGEDKTQWNWTNNIGGFGVWFHGAFYVWRRENIN